MLVIVAFTLWCGASTVVGPTSVKLKVRAEVTSLKLRSAEVMKELESNVKVPVSVPWSGLEWMPIVVVLAVKV